MSSGSEGLITAPEAKAKAKTNGIKGWILMLITIGIGALYGIHLYTQSLIKEATDNAQVVGNIIPISPKARGQVIEVKINDNEVVKKGDLLFTIDPRDYETKLNQAKSALATAENRLAQATIQARMSKRTTTSQVDEQVSSIAVVQQQVASAAQAVSVAQAESLRSEAGIQEAYSGIAAAKAGVGEAKANLVKAQAEGKRLADDHRRYADLYHKREISQQQFEAASTAAKLAQSQVEVARQGVLAAKASLESASALLANSQAAKQVAIENIARAKAGHQEAQARIEEANNRYQQAQAGTLRASVDETSLAGFKSEVERAKAQLKQAELDLSYTKIVAPIDGRIARKNINPGQFVEVGAPVLALVDESELWVVANYKETQLTRMAVGQKVSIEVDTYPGTTLEGKIDSIQSGTGAIFSLLPPENASGSFIKIVQRIPVKITLSPTEQRRLTLRPGMSVEATVWLQ